MQSYIRITTGSYPYTYVCIYGVLTPCIFTCTLHAYPVSVSVCAYICTLNTPVTYVDSNLHEVSGYLSDRPQRKCHNYAVIIIYVCMYVCT